MSLILVVEDEEFFRDVLVNVLKKEGHDVHGCADGKTAQHILGAKVFDLVISDINMPEVTGIQLAEWMKVSFPSIPMILMTGFAEIIETQQAYALGVKEFLTKPFQQGLLLEKVRSVFAKEAPKPKDEDRDAEFCKVRIEDFVSGKKIPYAIHIRLSKTKYVQVGQKGEDLAAERIQSYKSKNVDFLYMTKEDFGSYVGFSVNLAKVVSHSNKIPKEKKVGFLKYTSSVIMEHAYVNGVDEATFNQAHELLRETLDVISVRDDALDLLMLLNQHSDHLYAHSLAVSLYSVMLAKRAGWHSPRTVFSVSTSGMFHDIGKKEIDPNLLKKSRLEMTHEERATYETHTVRGGEILGQVKGIPDTVAFVARQHHEDINGYGFPHKLTRNKIHAVAKLVNVANVFCELVQKTPWSEGMSAAAALKIMSQTKKDALDQQFVFFLHQIFSIGTDKKRGIHDMTVEPDPDDSSDRRAA